MYLQSKPSPKEELQRLHPFLDFRVLKHSKENLPPRDVITPLGLHAPFLYSTQKYKKITILATSRLHCDSQILTCDM